MHNSADVWSIKNWDNTLQAFWRSWVHLFLALMFFHPSNPWPKGLSPKLFPQSCRSTSIPLRTRLQQRNGALCIKKRPREVSINSGNTGTSANLPVLIICISNIKMAFFVKSKSSPQTGTKKKESQLANSISSNLALFPHGKSATLAGSCCRASASKVARHWWKKSQTTTWDG